MCCGDVCWWINGDVCCVDVFVCVLWWCMLVFVVVIFIGVCCGHVLVCCVDALVCVVVLVTAFLIWWCTWLSICMLPWCLKSDDCCDNLWVKCASCNLWWYIIITYWDIIRYIMAMYYVAVMHLFNLACVQLCCESCDDVLKWCIIVCYHHRCVVVMHWCVSYCVTLCRIVVMCYD